uniref:protein-tyrosine-phosphatase n=1 Tax=Phallusia mammillata TaxID=59560 RepID=A0A6F9DQM0_9ASCI|nr:receptor-type tyrosine-protein phosphatase alpha-like [Phallusia mammillata]
MLKKSAFIARLRGKKKKSDNNENVVTTKYQTNAETKQNQSLADSRNSSQASFTPSGDDVSDAKPDDVTHGEIPLIATDDEEEIPTPPPPRPQNTCVEAKDLLDNFVAKHADEDRLFRAEFELMPAIVTSLMPKCDYAKRPEFRDKNRYRNIVTCNESRVILSKMDDDESSDYINASYIDGHKAPRKFIAAQGPKDNTVNDFWRMIWEQRCYVIVMITELWELGRKKCEQYWPADGAVEYGKIRVENDTLHDYGSFTMRLLKVTNCDEPDEHRVVSHFQYRAWPDHGAPKTTSEIFRFRKMSLEAQPSSDPKAGPILVHCSAGVGRTGTYIALDNLLGQLADDRKVDVFELILSLRQRRTEMVQSLDQYVLLHKLVTEYQMFGDTDLAQDDFQQKYEELCKTDEETGRCGFESQFDLLANTNSLNGRVGSGASEQNMNKNRDPDVIPYDHSKVFVGMRPTEQLPLYVNASVLQGYDVRRQMIAAQSPLEGTVEDLWRIVLDNNVTCVVQTTPLNVGDKELCHPYYPDSGSVQYGELTVQNDASRDHGSFLESLLTVKGNEREAKSQTLTHLCLPGWDDPDELSPVGGANLIKTLQFAVEKVDEGRAEGSKPKILVHCSDGAGRTGVFICLLFLIERLNREQRIDVFRSVKDARDYRPKMIRTHAQLKICYDVLLQYKELKKTKE